jgi:ribosomal protein S18 acetylase RimI-like enzyme
MEASATTDAHGLPVRPLPDGSDVRKVTEEELPRVVEAVAEGFYDDPLLSWTFPDDSRRLRQLNEAFGLFMRRVWFPHGHCYTTDRFAGGSFWLPPGTWHLGFLRQLLMLPAMLRLAGRDFPRLMGVLSAMEREHPHDRHYYLPVIGVAPPWQGRGFGSALLRPVLEICDRERLPAYLEASSPRNRALYERHGFRAVGEIRVKDSPPVWPMRREVHA